MDAKKATERKEDSPSQNTSLDKRYGKIGISAVAAAVRRQPEQRPQTSSRFTAEETD